MHAQHAAAVDSLSTHTTGGSAISAPVLVQRVHLSAQLGQHKLQLVCTEAGKGVTQIDVNGLAAGTLGRTAGSCQQ